MHQNGKPVAGGHAARLARLGRRPRRPLLAGDRAPDGHVVGAAEARADYLLATFSEAMQKLENAHPLDNTTGLELAADMARDELLGMVRRLARNAGRLRQIRGGGAQVAHGARTTTRDDTDPYARGGY